MKYQILIIAFLFFQISCQTNQANRTIASDVDQKLAVHFYETKLQQDFLNDQYKYQKQIEDLYKADHPLQKNIIYDVDPHLLERVSDLRNRAESEKNQLSRQADNYIQPTSQVFSFQFPWREHHDEFLLHDLQKYSLENGKIQRQISLSTNASKKTYLKLTNKFASWKEPRPTPPVKILGKPETPPPLLKAQMTCNDSLIHHKTLTSIKIDKGQRYQFDWFDEISNPTQTLFEFQNPETKCDLYFTDVATKKVYGVQLSSDSNQMKSISNPSHNFELCYLPSNTQLTGMEKFFTDIDTYRMSCPQKLDNFRTLENSFESVRAKIRLLTGKDLSDDFIKKADPFQPLDFSEAPKLDAILISYLVFRSDFSGTIILQALKHHAQRGAIIRIAISDVITLKKDRQMLFDFQSQFPNVKLVFYKYKNKNLGIRDKIDEFHRTNHIKIFLTYSKTDERNNQIIFGGRNIHDGFMFDHAPNSSSDRNAVIQYGSSGDEAWAHWEDFETVFQSTQLVQTVMGQYFSLFHLDYPTLFSRNYTENIPVKNQMDPQYFRLNENETLMRSFVSIPFKDDQLLESLYVKMIDSAEHEIKMSTPYFHLTKKIFNSLIKATDRGVKIQLITRLDLKGDTGDLILSDVNKEAVNRMYDKIKIYEFTTDGKILHSKLFLIDGKFVMLGSVNLNKRSFMHDLENTQLIYGQGYHKKIDEIYENYKKESKLLTEKQKTAFWKKIIIKIIGSAF